MFDPKDEHTGSGALQEVDVVDDWCETLEVNTRLDVVFFRWVVRKDYLYQTRSEQGREMVFPEMLVREVC